MSYIISYVEFFTELPVFTSPLFISPTPDLANRYDYYNDKLLDVTE